MGWGGAFRVMNHPSPGIRNRRLQLVAVLFSSSLIAFVQLRAAFTGEAAISMEDTLWMEALVSDVRDLSLADQLRMVVDSDYRGYVGGHRINAFICALLHPLGLPHAALARLLATLTSVAFVVLVWVLRDELGALTVLLVGVFHALLPARSIIMALYFMGNHSEMALFAVASLGLTMGALEAQVAGSRWTARAMICASGVVLGIGQYYCQSMMVWIAVCAIVPAAVWVKKLGMGGLLRLLPWALLGLLPGACLALVAYWPDQMFFLVFPYEMDPREAVSGAWAVDGGTEGLSAYWAETVGPFVAPTWPGGRFHLAAATSPLWLALAALLALRDRSLRLRAAVLSFIGFTVLLYSLVWRAQAFGPRFVVSAVLLTLTTQGIVLGELIPRALERFGPAVSRWSRPILGVLALVLSLSRVQDARWLGGRATWSQGWSLDTSLMVRLGLLGMRHAHQAPLRSVVWHVDGMGLDRIQVEALVRCMGVPFDGYQVDPVLSLPGNRVLGRGPLGIAEDALNRKERRLLCCMPQELEYVASSEAHSFSELRWQDVGLFYELGVFLGFSLLASLEPEEWGPVNAQLADVADRVLCEVSDFIESDSDLGAFDSMLCGGVFPAMSE